MQTVIKDVMSKGKVVGQVTIDLYDNVDELLENEKADVVVSMFNKANTIAIQAAERQKHTGKTGKQKRRSIAYNLLTEEEALTVAKGSLEDLHAKLESPEVQARVDKHLEEHPEDA